MRGPDELDPPRIYYTDPLTEAPRDAVHNAATRGFSHIMVPPPWQFGPRGDRFAPTSLTETDTGLPPEAALRPLCNLARAAGLGVLLDVAIDRVAAGAPVADAAVFQAPDLTGLLDPRRGTDASASSARLGNAAEATSLGAWWGTHIQRWRAEGAAGFRLLGLAACPADALPALMRPLRAAADAAMLLAWTPGMTPAQTQALRDTGLDGVFGSLPWWDFQAPWLWEENARLASVAPLIGAAAAPFGPVSGGRIGNMLAALMGAGWMATAANADDAAACNAMLTQTRPHQLAGLPVPLSSPGAKVLAVLRADTADTRQAARAALMLLNTDMAQARPADPAQFLPATGGAFAGFVPVPPGDAAPLSPTEPVLIPPGETRIYAADAACPPH